MALITGEQLAMFVGRAVDDDLTGNAAAVDEWIKRRNDRDFEHAQRTEWPRHASNSLLTTISLHEYPIESIDEVRIDVNGLFPDSSIVVELERIIVTDPESNEVEFRYGFFYPGPRRVQFKYTAGWWPIDDTDPAHVRKVPSDFHRMLLSVAATIDDMGERKEVFTSESRIEHRFARFETLLNPRQLEIADYFKRW